MRKVSTSFICLSLSTLGAVDRKLEIWRVGGGGGGEKIFLLYFIIFNKWKICHSGCNTPFWKQIETNKNRIVPLLKVNLINDGQLPKFHIIISFVLAKETVMWKHESTSVLLVLQLTSHRMDKGKSFVFPSLVNQADKLINQIHFSLSQS